MWAAFQIFEIFFGQPVMNAVSCLSWKGFFPFVRDSYLLLLLLDLFLSLLSVGKVKTLWVTRFWPENDFILLILFYGVLNRSFITSSEGLESHEPETYFIPSQYIKRKTLMQTSPLIYSDIIRIFPLLQLLHWAFFSCSFVFKYKKVDPLSAPLLTGGWDIIKY